MRLFQAPLRTSAQENAGGFQPARLPPRGVEPLSESAQVAIRQAFTESGESVLAFCLALLNAEQPELANVLTLWPQLPETVHARILGIIEGATAAGSGV